jgi:hypothetical protein
MAGSGVESAADDLNRSMARVVSCVDEAVKAVVDGKPDGAALVLGTQGGKLAEFNEAWTALYAAVGGPDAGKRALAQGGE